MYEGENFTYHEDLLWDFKKTTFGCFGEENKSKREDDFLKLVRQCISFYNSSGGYLLFGVDNVSRQYVGFDKIINVDVLKEKIRAHTKSNIDILYQNLKFKDQRIGVLFVPRRNEELLPVRIYKSGVLSTGDEKLKKGDIIFRYDNSTKTAKGPDDYCFIFSQDHSSNYSASTNPSRSIYADLPPRDPNFVEFFGRQKELLELWEWMFERHNPSKLVTGIGGIGKTTLVREFCEQLENSPPFSVQNIMWFSAKKLSFDAADDSTKINSGPYKPDFTSPVDLYRVLMNAIGFIDDEINGFLDGKTPPEGQARDELIEAIGDALHSTPIFLVVDDLDTLSQEDQSEIIDLISDALSEANKQGTSISRCIFTTRLTLGVSGRRLVQVEGLERKEFIRFVESFSQNLKIKKPYKISEKQWNNFHRFSSGSPLFVQSILRLVVLGENLDQALTRWKDNQGEDVRKFAFKRELNQLSERQLRTLYAICCAENTSRVELEDVLQIGETSLRDDLKVLSSFHLASVSDPVLYGGDRLKVSQGITVLMNLIAERIDDPKSIQRKINNVRRKYTGREADIGELIGRCRALWLREDYSAALQMIETAAMRRPKVHPDLSCILGCCYLKVLPKDLKKAIAAFEEAHSANCSREELYLEWFDMSAEQQDWASADKVSSQAIAKFNSGKYIYLNAVAKFNIAKELRTAGSQVDAIATYVKAGTMANRAFKKDGPSGAYGDVREIRREAFENAIDLSNVNLNVGQTSIQAFEHCYTAFENSTRTPFMFAVAHSSASFWVRAIFQERQKKHINTLHKISETGRKIETMTDAILESKYLNERFAVSFSKLGAEYREKNEVYKTYFDDQ